MAPGKTRSIVCSARNFFQFTVPGPAWWQIQRKLQLRIEEQGRQLKKTFDQQQKTSNNLLNTKNTANDEVAKVQISNRLSSSPCVLVSGKFGWSANMERLMKAQALGDTASLEFMRGRRILEINIDHPIIKDLSAACKNAPDSSDAKRAVDLLYDTAIISSGFSVRTT